MKMKKIYLFILVAALAASVSAEYDATIYGYVTDQKTGAPFSDVQVDVFFSDDPSTPFVTVQTDERGFYNASVHGDRNYDIYVRMGSNHPHQETYVGRNEVRGHSFTINMETISEQTIIDQPYFWVIALIAILVVGVIVFDEIFMRKRKISGLEAEKEKLTERIESTVETDELTALEKKRDRINLMVKMAQLKFHKRQLDEESFREIIRDKQKELIEIEARISELKEKDGRTN